MRRTLRDGAETTQDLLPYDRETNPSILNDPSGNGAEEPAELLPAHEFIHRPRNASSLETLGLTMICYPSLSKISTVPNGWVEARVLNQADNPSKPLDLDDWKALLRMILDFHVRENSFANSDEQRKRWLDKCFSGKSLLLPDIREKQTLRKRAWPQAQDRGQQPRAVGALQAVTGLDIQNPLARYKINSWLKTVQKQLTTDSNALYPDADAWKIPSSAMALKSPEKEMWIYPQSHHSIDAALCGVSPYLPGSWQEMPSEELFCSKTEIPDYYCSKQGATVEPRCSQMRRLLRQNEDVGHSRQEGLWSSLNDKIVEGGFYYCAVEHSTQAASTQLNRYEQMLKERRINVLSCPTTMEMGVDIGGMAAVVMNSVPLHPANYLQHAGHADRRSGAAVITYTLCENGSHSRRVSTNPKWTFTTAIAAPKVLLSSGEVISRHVYSLLLAAFLAKHSDTSKSHTKLNTAWSFNPTRSIWQQFCDWINSPECSAIGRALGKPTVGTALGEVPLTRIKASTRQRLLELAEN